ncbi:MAG: hypothetical protein KKE17_01255 [Proteobacteria bacterium]|nr:hypothetical protein [Pseudomonadota bacterium]MBU1708609.1 hypothetical protein [Pseudomonadota bacterium]
MSKKKLNCWEFKKCGREPGGENVITLGVCPASTEKSMDGIHRGDNAGRSCWIIAGTYCGGKVQGNFAAKLENCTKCDFFQIVITEEKTEVQDAIDLLEVLKIVTR